MIADMAQKFFQEMDRKLPQFKELLPRQEVKSALQAALARMDLVTREEFDAQTAVLQRTRARLEALEDKLAELEQQDKQNP